MASKKEFQRVLLGVTNEPPSLVRMKSEAFELRNWCSKCFSTKKIKTHGLKYLSNVWQVIAKLTKLTYMLTQESYKFSKLLSFILLQLILLPSLKNGRHNGDVVADFNQETGHLQAIFR